jgi:hypothetical protein
MAAFYNQKDQDIYKTNKFMPQSRFLFDTPTDIPVEEKEKVTESFGIPNTNAFTNSGGGGGGGPTGDLINNFNTSTGNRQYNLNNPNKVNQFVNKGMGIFGMTPQRSVRDMLSPQDLNFGRDEFNQNTLSYDRTNMPGVLQPDVRKTSGIPLGIGAMIARGLPDKYYDMNTADQAYTQSNMGYTGPTIFGENNMSNKDPFGRNVRSAFGNYPEAQQKSIDKMNERMSTKLFTDKYGSGLSLEEDEDGNYSYVGPGSAYANKMNKVNLARYTFDKKGLDRYDKIKNISQLRKQQRKDYEKKTGQELDAADRAFGGPDGTGDYDEYSGAGGTPNYSIPDTNDPGGGSKGYSQERNDAGLQSAEDDMKDGGRAGYFFGGRVNYKAGGRIRFQGGGRDAGKDSDFGSENFGGDKDDNREQYGAVGQYSTGPTSTKTNDGGVTKPVFYDKNDNIITTDFISKNPNLTINYADPRNYASLKSKIGFNNILDNDDITAEGDLTGKFGPVSYNTNFTDKGITETNLTAGNFNAKISPDMQLENLSYSKGPFSISSDGKNTKAGLTFSYKNGGLASIL